MDQNAAGCMGCLGLVALCIVLGLVFSAIESCSGGGGSSDCYTTGEPGSAQEQRDIERCLGQ